MPHDSLFSAILDHFLGFLTTLWQRYGPGDSWFDWYRLWTESYRPRYLSCLPPELVEYTSLIFGHTLNDNSIFITYQDFSIEKVATAVDTFGKKSG